MNDDLYVLTVERDTYEPTSESRPIVWEQYLDQGAASLKSVKAHQNTIGDRYGKIRIAKLVFLEEDGVQ